jgi:hypothetical protein
MRWIFDKLDDWSCGDNPLVKTRMRQRPCPSTDSDKMAASTEEKMNVRRNETPHVSYLASPQGNTGKSTARMASTVTSIIWHGTQHSNLKSRRLGHFGGRCVLSSELVVV